jgi:hypothetical protein
MVCETSECYHSVAAVYANLTGDQIPEYDGS